MSKDMKPLIIIYTVSKRNKREKLLNGIIIVFSFIITGLVAVLIKS